VYTLPIPSRFAAQGYRRYGFHGLSYEYLMETLRSIDESQSRGRVVLAHLGSGASMAAVRDGVGVDTTMGFTPLGGLPMGTRTGDLDPGVVLAIMKANAYTPDDMNAILNHESGLLGLSETSPHMLDLLQREESDPRAHLAIELFCYQARKQIGAYIAALGGLDTLVFSGGMGEQSAPIRERICAGMEELGIVIDPQANAKNAPIVSLSGARVTVRVIPTNEEWMIAKTARTFSDIL
jgi:acetate kinase